MLEQSTPFVALGACLWPLHLHTSHLYGMHTQMKLLKQAMVRITCATECSQGQSATRTYKMNTLSIHNVCTVASRLYKLVSEHPGGFLYVRSSAVQNSSSV
jgi:hypothetical protein